MYTCLPCARFVSIVSTALPYMSPKYHQLPHACPHDISSRQQYVNFLHHSCVINHPTEAIKPSQGKLFSEGLC